MKRLGLGMGLALAVAAGCGGVVVGGGGCDGSGDGPHPTGSGVRVEPQITGSYTLVRGLFPHALDASESQGISEGSFRGVILGDCNGDGLLDVFDPADRNLYVQQAGGAFSKSVAPLYPNSVSGGTFVDLDLDGTGPDGTEDLVIANEAITVLRGLGNCQFAAPVDLAPKSTGWVGQILVRDVDGDGLTDLAVTNDNGTDVAYRLLLAQGDGSFADATPPSTPLMPASSDGYITYGVFFDDVDGDGVSDLFSLVDNGESWFSWGVAGETPTLAPDGSLSNLMMLASPMGLSPLDADRDGRIDYFLPIGKSRLLWNRGPRDLVDYGVYAGLEAPEGMDDWGSLAFDADLDGWPDLLVLRIQDGTYVPGQVALHINRHDGTFSDVGGTVFAGATMQAQALVCGDLTSNGKVSCYAREPTGSVLLENNLTSQNHWVGLRLRGTVSGADATGARVSLDGESRPLVIPVGGQAPSWSEHRRDVLVAVGQQTQSSLTITWPSGLSQSVSLPAGTYSPVVEPRVLTVSRRVAPADGMTTIQIVADPTASGAAQATIASDGAGSWQGPAVQGTDGKWTRTLVAPSQPGIARITLTLDGKPLLIKPRVRFTAQ